MNTHWLNICNQSLKKMPEKSVLFEAIEAGDSRTVQSLIKSGVDLSQKALNGCSPMQVAVALGHLEVAQTLLSAGAEIDCLNEHIFGRAVHYQRLDIICFLIEMGIDVNLRFIEDEERTALIEATAVGNIDIVKKLVESGADVNAISRQNEYALMNAASKGCQEICNYLAPLTSPELRKWVEKLHPQMVPSEAPRKIDILSHVRKSVRRYNRRQSKK
ncbi:ankyrin repeat domain-containing protein [Roseofilum sp. Guam]|uniref:ankyrin repeat domain-containing protein n=1 Tax=Roseofilum sp. Guam TaxID=2821502 RepID=UPI001B17447E|nr:ankyrin repeat domain-containing protein [Roseofilum sp. Guam]MBP0030443.1 ankyrin repeat domain-containing protein [Roseofilum sp. Guam]